MNVREYGQEEGPTRLHTQWYTAVAIICCATGRFAVTLSVDCLGKTFVSLPPAPACWYSSPSDASLPYLLTYSTQIVQPISKDGNCMRDDCSGKDEVRLRLYRIERAVIDADRRLLSVIVGRSWMRAKRFVGMRTDMVVSKIVIFLRMCRISKLVKTSLVCVQ